MIFRSHTNSPHRSMWPSKATVSNLKNTNMLMLRWAVIINMRAAIVHVIADAAVSVLVICGLLLAWTFGWLWMDPLAGIIGALVIANWAYGLIRDTGTILLDMNPDKTMTENLRQSIETDGDKLADLHLWRLGPGHLGAVVSVVTNDVKRDQQFYRKRLSRFRSLSHLTIEVLSTD